MHKRFLKKDLRGGVGNGGEAVEILGGIRNDKNEKDISGVICKG